MKQWEEGKHPRDEDGKFTDGTPAEKEKLETMGIKATNESLTAEEQRLQELGVEETKENFKNKYFKEKIDRNNEDELKSKISGYLNRIVQDKKEHEIVIDKNGNVFENVGDETYVEDVGVNLDGAINIHNHLENGSFAEDDFNFYKNKVGTEFICVTPKYIHTLKVKKEIDKPYNYFYRNGLQDDDNWENQAHYIMEFIKSEGYIEYEKNLRNS